jgi:hypothetical protein
MQPLDSDAQGQLFAEFVMPADMAARRPTAAIEWKETCRHLSGCSPISPMLQGFARGSTPLQVFQQSLAALSWVHFLTSQTIAFSSPDSAQLNAITGLRDYSVIIRTPTHNPSEHLATIKVQVDGSRYASVPQLVRLTPGSCEHACVIAIDDALGRFVLSLLFRCIVVLRLRCRARKFYDAVFSLKGITLIAAGEVSRLLLPVHTVVLKHGDQQARAATVA